MAVALPKRAELEEKYTWNLGSIFPNTQAWQEMAQQVAEALPSLESYKGHLGDSPHKLLEWFHEYETSYIRVGHLQRYSSMLHDTDMADQQANALKDQGLGL